MCLATVDEKIKPTDQERYAWKVFVLRKGALSFPYYAATGKWCYFQDGEPGNVERGEWLRAKRRRTNDGQYTSGFHVFQTERGAREYARDGMRDIPSSMPRRVVRVRVRRVRLRGTQYAGNGDARPALVADEMYVPKKAR